MILAALFCEYWLLIFAMVPMSVQVKRKDMETNSELPVLALVEVKPSQLALGWELGGNRKRKRRRTLVVARAIRSIHICVFVDLGQDCN